MTSITIGHDANAKPISLLLKMATKHGLIAGSTGMGKTVTMQKLAEQFSAHGVPVFTADIKGDLSGLSSKCPTTFWDLYGKEGFRIRTSVQEFGADLLAEMLGLNPAQAGTLAIAFQKAEDDREFLLTLDDLRWSLNDMRDNRESISAKYGNVTAVSISTIIRAIFVLESQGGIHLFGEPGFDIKDFMRTFRTSDDDFATLNGAVNILTADRLIESPRIYAIFLLWLLRELFRVLPEAGDVDVPKMIFMFDEAHLLFRDAPKPLLQEIERLVRLVRSKGVGVFFVTQSPRDIPDAVLAQLGNRIQHCLRAYTRKDQAMVKAAADAFRQDRTLDVRKTVTELGIGEAIVSVLDVAGVPTMASKVKVEMPGSTVGPISKMERDVIINRDTLGTIYRGDDTKETQAAKFNSRMLADRGIEAKPAAEDWKEGDYLAFVPSDKIVEVDHRPSRLFHLRRVALWCMFTAGAVYMLSVIA